MKPTDYIPCLQGNYISCFLFAALLVFSALSHRAFAVDGSVIVEGENFSIEVTCPYCNTLLNKRGDPDYCGVFPPNHGCTKCYQNIIMERSQLHSWQEDRVIREFNCIKWGLLESICSN